MHDIDIQCYSVGGPKNYRNLRALLMSTCAPTVTSQQLETEERGPRWSIPAVPLVTTMAAEAAAPVKFAPDGPPIYPELDFVKTATVASKIQCAPGDAVLIIGKPTLSPTPPNF